MRVTSPARTALDLAALSGRAKAAESAIGELVALRHVTVDQLVAICETRAGSRGCATLRSLIGGDFSRFKGERRLARLIASSSSLPVPERNTVLCGWEIDFLWRDARFYVELDGGPAHSTPTKFESDRRRDAELQLQGFAGQRVTWMQVTREAAETLRRIERGHAISHVRMQNFPLSGNN
ncbi:hypothetical protein BH10ACT11_BH10ACT11_20020 [soil metagenome]